MFDIFIFYITIFFIFYSGLPEEEESKPLHDAHQQERAKQKQRQSQVSLLTRSWHSIDFKQQKSKSKESIRSRASRRNLDV